MLDASDYAIPIPIPVLVPSSIPTQYSIPKRSFAFIILDNRSPTIPFRRIGILDNSLPPNNPKSLDQNIQHLLLIHNLHFLRTVGNPWGNHDHRWRRRSNLNLSIQSSLSAPSIIYTLPHRPRITQRPTPSPSRGTFRMRVTRTNKNP